MRIVVDDDAGVRLLLHRALDRLGGVDVHEASDGLAAAGLVRKLHPDLVLMDLNMPRMDGFELCRLVKGDSATAHAAVIAVTAEMSAANRTRIMESGRGPAWPSPSTSII